MLHLAPRLHRQSLVSQMVPIQGGAFMLGGRTEVTLSDFALCRFPVTQQLYKEVMGVNPSYFQGPQRPVEQVSWYDAVEFCNKLSDTNGLIPCYQIDKEIRDPLYFNEADTVGWSVKIDPGANGYRLPTLAEWEFAASGGNLSNDNFRYAGSQQIMEVCWYGENSFNESQPVGLKRPNQLGLFDMSGNVWEMCWDWSKKSIYASLADDPDLKGHAQKISKGGSWDAGRHGCSVTYSRVWIPDVKTYLHGFRLARSL